MPKMTPEYLTELRDEADALEGHRFKEDRDRSAVALARAVPSLLAEVERLQRIEAAAREVVEAGSSREALRLCADLADVVGAPDAR